MLKRENFSIVIVILAVMISFQNCSDVNFSPKKIASGGSGGVKLETTPLELKFFQPPANYSGKVDILFVVDSSGSLDPERGDIANNIDTFVSQLPANSDYTIGVVLAHSPLSIHSGLLYKKSSQTEYILRSSTMSLEEIRTQLHARLTSLPVDNAADGGEEGLLALDRFLDNATPLSAMPLAVSAMPVVAGALSAVPEVLSATPVVDGASAASSASSSTLKKLDNDAIASDVDSTALTSGLDNDALVAVESFLRPDAALAVIFVADENDICAVYPTGVTRVPDEQFHSSGVELELYAQQRDCGALTAQSVYNKLIELKQGLPLMVTGVMYTNPAITPEDGENEVGYGYTDIINLNQGFSVDIGGDIPAGLNAIGDLLGNQLELRTRFHIANTQIHDCASQVVASSIVVTVDGVAPVAFEFNAATCDVVLDATDAGLAESEISVAFDFYAK